jgi:hypothetical protein
MHNNKIKNSKQKNFFRFPDLNSNGIENKINFNMNFIFAVLLLFSAVESFKINRISNSLFGINHVKTIVLRMSEEPVKTEAPKTELVPVDKVNIENAAAVTGGILGFVLGGPVLAAILAAITNYVAKKEGESGEAIRGVGKTVVESFNFLTKLNSKYNITGKVADTVGSAVSSIETDSEVFDTVKKTYATTVTKISEIDKEYDLASKGKEVLIAAGTLSDAALDKLTELNAKVKFICTIYIFLFSMLIFYFINNSMILLRHQKKQQLP